MTNTTDKKNGVKCFSIGGRMVYDRQRRLGMTDEERRWRAQWLKDQVLAPNEPRDLPEYYKETTNFLRRIYKTPMYYFHNALRSVMAHDKAFVVRHFVGKMTMIVGLTYITAYVLKYHSNDFAGYKNMSICRRRPAMHPSHPDYPNYYKKKPHEFYDEGFYSSVLAKPH